MHLLAVAAVVVDFAQAPNPADDPLGNLAYLYGRLVVYLVAAGVIAGIVIAFTKRRRKRPSRSGHRDDRRPPRRDRLDRSPPARRVDPDREDDDRVSGL